jgi:acyl-CoA dehydrogenase
VFLLNPKDYQRTYPDEPSRDMMLKTIAFFEAKGKRKLKEDDRNRVWYADFLAFQKQEKLFSTLLTPQQYGDGDTRWDTWRICGMNEILAFYGLHYWYTWQVSILGLGPIWMSGNAAAKERAAHLLGDGEIFAFGLSERAHGADIYSTEMQLEPLGEGKYRANGSKYYIGNGNEAKMVSTFGKMADSDDYVFFVANYQRPEYDCVQNVVNSQSHVSEFALSDYPVTEADILSVGQEAWDTAFNTVNIGKFNLGWASIGICTHAYYEAIRHAANRRLYGMQVTDFPHVKRMFVDAYARLVAMKLVALRAADYMRTASLDDRRYLLYNPVVKMKVTTQGEEVINLLWDVIAAKGFERDTFFEMATRDIRCLPKLEGTVHVNIALIIKFMTNYLFKPAACPDVPRQDEARNDAFLFAQGPTGGLGRIQFQDYDGVYGQWDLPNVRLFREQIAVFKECLAAAPPDDAQRKDLDLIMSVGEIFTLVVYGQLILENARIYAIGDALVDQIFDFMVRDFSKFAMKLYSRPGCTQKQMDYCLKMVRKPVLNAERYDRVWQEEVLPLKDAYEMNA